MSDFWKKLGNWLIDSCACYGYNAPATNTWMEGYTDLEIREELGPPPEPKQTGVQPVEKDL